MDAIMVVLGCIGMARRGPLSFISVFWYCGFGYGALILAAVLMFTNWGGSAQPNLFFNIVDMVHSIASCFMQMINDKIYIILFQRKGLVYDYILCSRLSKTFQSIKQIFYSSRHILPTHKS